MLSDLAARLWAPVRAVSPLPPHEPFAPVYDYEPTHGDEYGRDGSLSAPRWPDALVFGPEYPRCAVTLDLSARCGPCGVTWAVSEGRACWCCGRPA